MLRLLSALLAGVFVSGFALFAGTGDEDLVWVMYLLPVLIICLVLLSVGKALRGTRVLPDQMVQSLLNQNLGALARIEKIRRTGTTVNDAPLCELTLVVAPADRDAYLTTTRVLLDIVELPRFQPGRIVLVSRLKPDRPNVYLVREPDTEWQRRIDGEADRIPPSSQVRPWDADPNDTDLPGPKPILGTGEKGRKQRMIAYFALFIVGIGGMWGLNRAEVQTMFDGSPPPGEAAPSETDSTNPPEDFVNGDGQQTAVDALVEVIGSRTIIDMHFYDNGNVLATAPSRPGDLTIDDYGYTDGKATHDDPTLIQPDQPNLLLFDIGKVDVTRISDYIGQTRELTGITKPDSSTASVSREIPDPITGDKGKVQITLSVSDAYYSGYVIMATDGKILTMWGGKPGSDAYQEEHDRD